MASVKKKKKHVASKVRQRCLKCTVYLDIQKVSDYVVVPQNVDVDVM